MYHMIRTNCSVVGVMSSIVSAIHFTFSVLTRPDPFHEVTRICYICRLWDMVGGISFPLPNYWWHHIDYFIIQLHFYFPSDRFFLGSNCGLAALALYTKFFFNSMTWLKRRIRMLNLFRRSNVFYTPISRVKAAIQVRSYCIVNIMIHYYFNSLK